MSTHLQRLGKYELRERLGRGGMAEVWKAFDPQLERYVAIKILHPDLLADPDFMNRFIREARVIASLHHPNIVQIHDFQISHPPESSTPLAYMVMEYVEGQTLAEYIRNTSRVGKFPPAGDIVYLFTAIGKAIDYAHQQGMIHRDIKPANILLDKRNTRHSPVGEPILTDFGIAKLLGASSGTMSGMWIGTPLYISPEQVQGYPGNERSDIYSLGVILYEICTGVPPFRGETIAAIMMQHVSTMPTPPALINPHIPPLLSMVIVRAMAKDPAARFSSAGALAAALAEALNMPVPADLSLSALPVADMSGPTYLSPLPPAAQPGPAPGLLSPGATPSSSPVMGGPVPHVALSTPQFTPSITPAASSGHGTPAMPPGAPSSSLPNQPATAPPGTSLPAPTTPVPPAPRVPVPPWWRRGLLVALLLLLVLGGALGAFLVFGRPAPAPPAPQIVGHAFFVSSGQISEESSQGINDQVQVDLYNIPDPAPGKAYYTWLLSDLKQTEWTPVFLGRLAVNHGEVHFHYLGDPQHTNLLEITSRFLITEEDASVAPVAPALDQSAWRYYAVLPQTPDPTDTVDHFSALDHLRHLLAQDPKLKALNLPGGLDIWLFRNTEKIFEWSGSARDYWAQRNPAGIHNQVVRILDYLDGSHYVQADVPPGTPLLVNPRIAPVALLEFDPQNQNPPGYLFHINKHLKALTHAPGTSPNQRKLAAQINTYLDNVRYWLEKVHADARQLITMDDAQLLAQATLSLLDDMETQARAAYIGQIDPNTNQVRGGVIQIHFNIQLLATFAIAPFTPAQQ